jgi:hypothetical protein
LLAKEFRWLVLLEPHRALPKHTTVRGLRTALKNQLRLIQFTRKEVSRYMLVLKMVNRHLAKLTRQYTATQKGNPRALAIAEELSQVGTVRDQIQRIHEKLGRSGQAPRSLPSESPTVETLLRRLDKLARQFAEAPREDPRKSEIVNEITRLSFLADSLFKSKKSP